jgi:hypothetical protein
VGTQPWPIGRYGSCELMIGCIAKATNYYMKPNEKEMEDAQWYDRKELLQVGWQPGVTGDGDAAHVWLCVREVGGGGVAGWLGYAWGLQTMCSQGPQGPGQQQGPRGCCGWLEQHRLGGVQAGISSGCRCVLLCMAAP